MFTTGMRNCASRLIEVGAILKAHLLASVAIVALAAAAPALAADLPLKAPTLVAAPWSWSGFYIGGHGGYGWGHDSFTNVNDPFFGGKFPSFTATGFDPKGYLGGFQAGANWQSGSIVAGLEADLSFTNIKGSSSSTATPAVDRFGFGITTTGAAANSGTFDLLGSGRAGPGSATSSRRASCSTAPAGWRGRVSSRTRTRPVPCSTLLLHQPMARF
jgi:hypothetical protein